MTEGGRRPAGPPFSRRGALLALAAGATGLRLTDGLGSQAAVTGELRILDDGPTRPISPYVYGDNEIGTLDGGAPSALAAARAEVSARRLGGNLMTTYNWTNNATNSGKDWRHVNALPLPRFLGLDAAAAARPAAVIEAMHRTAQAMGAISLVTLPLAGHVAADAAGPVSPGEAAPSPRWAPVSWRDDDTSEAAPGPGPVSIPRLLRRLTTQFGGARDPGGVRAYALDNEPSLWPETHPRIVPGPVRIARFIARSLEAARVIRRIDPDAWIFGPVCWGLTAFLDFHGAPDWPERRRYGNFLAFYLDAFRRESERAGVRLLDALDVHWYAYSHRGDLFRTEDPALADAVLDAPRALSEQGWREASWVGDSLARRPWSGLSLPILPSLREQIARWFPGTGLAVTEFNFGGGGRLVSALALADALGRFGREGVLLATHWGDLDGWLCEAYRLYRGGPGAPGRFGAASVGVVSTAPPEVCAYAARDGAGALHVTVINKTRAAARLTLAPSSGRPFGRLASWGFDADRPLAGQTAPDRAIAGGAIAVEAPPLSARRFVLS